ncbi:helix-turn-helix domain-containing protein [Bartonella harrusi]|uniref:Helix-turn-helix domain-containing protein n=1 Tax=Bartonella harrusi TaxID=2961895 RepID=A0ABY5EUT6_9HYPH|nr:helix-turn-helix transcriptional regulator [Bartonella harrusi]UTO29047.1 helix-turn-helix domain-containing protein [Bartonella harrusi]
MITPFGKTLRKLRIDHSERLLDMAKKLDISVPFLSSVEIGKKSVPVGMEEKIIEVYALNQEAAARLRRESDACRSSFTIKSSDPLCRETIGMFTRLLKVFSQQDLESFKGILEAIREEKSQKNVRVAEEC